MHADRVDAAFMSPLHFAVLLNKEAIVQQLIDK